LSVIKAENHGVNQILPLLTPSLLLLLCVSKKHPEHFQLQFEEKRSDFNNFWEKYFWDN